MTIKLGRTLAFTMLTRQLFQTAPPKTKTYQADLTLVPLQKRKWAQHLTIQNECKAKRLYNQSYKKKQFVSRKLLSNFSHSYHTDSECHGP